MMGTTHAALGFAAGAAVYAAMTPGAPNASLALVGALGTAAALLPDIDHPASDIRRRMGIFSALLGWLPHRGITHSLAALGFFALVVWMAAGRDAVLAAAVAGYASHLAADAATKTGIPLLLPFSPARVWLLPKPLRIRTNGRAEWLFAGALIIGISFWLPQLLADGTIALSGDLLPRLTRAALTALQLMPW